MQMGSGNVNEKLACQLIAKQKLKEEFLGVKTPFLYVEGSTDKRFYSRILKSNVNCVFAKEYIESRGSFKSAQEQNEEKLINCKDVIVRICKKLIFEQSNTYGIIDKDGDDIDNNQRLHLYVSDTYDLETMLMFTDNDWYMRMGIPQDDVKKAIFIAVQLSSITHALRAVNCENVSDLNAGSKEVEYCEFVNDKNDCKISLSMLLTYLFANEKEADEKSYAVLKEMQNCKACKRVINKFSKEGLRLWIGDYGEIDDTSALLWQDINGHVALQSLRFVNDEANNKYRPRTRNEYRNFEHALISVYDYNCFRKTKLYQLMSKENLIDEAKIG